MILSYTHELIQKAKELGELLSIDHTGYQFQVSVRNVFSREKNSYLKRELFGVGFTIDDACYDYIRKARGGLMIHIISDKTIEVV